MYTSLPGVGSMVILNSRRGKVEEEDVVATLLVVVPLVGLAVAGS